MTLLSDSKFKGFELNCYRVKLPVVQVFWWAGREAATKEKVIKGITKVFEELGVPAEAVTVIIHDVPRENWGTGGEQASKKLS